MLYSIIPPILIVLSLIGIILFLMKKAPEAARLEQEENRRAVFSEIRSRETGFSPRERLEEAVPQKDMGQKLLFLLEKVIRRLKLLFLKLENIFSSWSESIKKRRNKRIESREKMILPDRVEDPRSFLKEETLPEKSQIDPRARFGRSLAGADMNHDPEPFQTIRAAKNPLGAGVERKEMLEKILIERIAANPRDTEAYQRLGEYYIEIKSWEDAKECFKQVLKLDPRNFSVKLKMKKLERLLGR